MQRINLLVVIIILLSPLTAGAVPQLLKHQGYMSNNQGAPSTGSANLTFNLYTVENDGSSIWTQTIPVTFDAGYYSVVLGPGTPELSVENFDGSDLYLGVTLEGQDEFLPRMQIASAPYAFRAKAVEGEVKAVGGLVVDGVEVINDQQQWIGNNISFNDLADVPEDLADGDDVGLEGSGTDGTLARFTESGLGDSALVEIDGKIGVGTDDPQSTVHIAGGVQIQDDTDDCVEGKEGTLRWHESKVEVCDGNSWSSIAPSASGGQSQSDAGTSCKTILDSGASQGSGIYWVNPNEGDTNDAFQAYCDMETDNGGWTIVYAATGADGEQNMTSNTESNGDPLAFEHHNLDRQKKMWLSTISTESILVRNNGTWLKIDQGLYDDNLNTGNSHQHYQVNLASSNGTTAAAWIGYSNYNHTGGGDYNVSHGNIDHHTSTYYHLNSGCVNSYLYSYSNAPGDNDAGYDVSRALGDWGTTQGCHSGEGGALVFYAAMR